MAVAVFFWFQGAVLVLPFALLELAALATAFVVYARHAADSERVSLQGGRLIVELETAGHVRRSEFVREWVRVEPLSRGQLVEVRSGLEPRSVADHWAIYKPGPHKVWGINHLQARRQPAADRNDRK